MIHSKALLLALVPLALSACGGDTEQLQTDTRQQMPAETTAERPPAREGPDGCYIPSRQKCDCEIQEPDCKEDVGVWTSGCTSCAM